MTHGSAQSIQSPHDEDVTALECIEALQQARSITLRPGKLIPEDMGSRDSMMRESIELESEVLVICRNTGIAEGAAGHSGPRVQSCRDKQLPHPVRTDTSAAEPVRQPPRFAACQELRSRRRVFGRVVFNPNPIICPHFFQCAVGIRHRLGESQY